MALGLCDDCKRFARNGSCPFCGGSVAPNPWRSVARLSRAAAAAVALSGCTQTVQQPVQPPEPTIDAGHVAIDPIPAPTPMYGAAPAPTLITPDPEPVPTVAPMYGAAPRIGR